MHENPPLPTVFNRPRGNCVLLTIRPRLASWNAAGEPDQVRLKDFLDYVEGEALPLIEQLDDPLALSLDVALPPDLDLVNHHDLDNYAEPVARRLAKASGRQFVSVWCTKQHGETSFLCVSTAMPSSAHQIEEHRWLPVHTTASSEKTAYKEQISSQIKDSPIELDDGPVALQLAFTLGPRRNWINLWKATIDSLDLILGRTYPAKQWNPKDGRITELGLHCQVDGDVGNDVLIAIAARRH
jgi:hypothetical protein